jgi:hypothetical protein
MTPEKAAELRKPFPPEHVGKLPRGPIQIDYVGHGATTDRLLEVDPLWNWEPLRFNETDGMPTFGYDDRGNPISLWIKLTVCGVTRLGVGTCPSGQADAEKVLIGDALRNAAMRFGVALDLWIKGHAEDDERQSAGQRSSDRRQPRGRNGQARQRGPADEPPPASEAAQAKPAADRAKVARITGALDQLDPGTIAELQEFVAGRGMPEHPRFLNDEQADEVIAWLTERLSAEVAS